jgi:hypothetical protein
VLGRDKGTDSPTLQGRLQSLLRKGPNLPTRSPIPQICHLRGKQVVCSIPQPKTKKEVQEFLGAAGFCHIWIPGYSSLAKPLFEATAGTRKDPLNWGLEQEMAFQEIKRLLTSTPALRLPDVK